MIKYKEIVVKCISINNPHLNIDYESIKKGYNYTARLYKDYDDIYYIISDGKLEPYSKWNFKPLDDLREVKLNQLLK